MSQIARVFVVLNLLVAAGFMFAASTFLGMNEDYKKQLTTEKGLRETDRLNAARDLQAEKTKNERLSGENTAAQEQITRLTTQVQGLESSLATATAEITAKNGQIAELQRVNGEHANAVQGLRQDVARLTEQNTNLDKAQRDAVTKQVEAEGKLSEQEKKNLDASNRIADLEKDVTTKAQLIKDRDMMIEFARNRGMNFESLMPQENVAGVVVNADNSMKLVQASVGSDDKVSRGYVFDIIRGGSYIGRFRVDTVYKKTCAGQLVLTAPGQQVMVGDTVTTSLY